MLSKNAAAFGVEALIGKKRPIDLEVSEASLIDRKYSANKHFKTQPLLPNGVGKYSEEDLSLPSLRNVKIKLEEPKESLPDYPNKSCHYSLNGKGVIKSLHEVALQKGSVVNHETELMKRQSSVQRFYNFQFHEGEKANNSRPSSTRRESCQCSSGRIMKSAEVSLQLLNHELWSQFHQHQTEMIITKNGRRMFPVVKVRIFGLDPDASYLLYLDPELLDGKRYRYAYPNSCWTVSGTGEPLNHNQIFIHPDSPATGRQWMDAPLISFDKLKLTNNKATESKGQLFFHSMQKYVPRIWVQKLKDSEIAPKSESEENLDQLEYLVNRDQAEMFVFNETAFITVTAYQNQQITKLKINSNPFAKGFRENTKHKDTTTLCLKASSEPQDFSTKMAQGFKDTLQTRNLYPSFPSFFPRISPIYLDSPFLPYNPSSYPESFLPLQTCNPLLTTSLVPSNFTYTTLLMPNQVIQKKSEHPCQSYVPPQFRTIPQVFPNINGMIPPPPIIPQFQTNSKNREIFLKSLTSNSFRISNIKDSMVKLEERHK